MKKLLALLLCCTFLAGCGGSTTPSTPPPPPTITGTWSGNVTSAVFGTSASVNGNLVQGVTNPDGSIKFSGSLNFTGGCISLLQISGGTIIGNSFALSGSFSDGTTLNVVATINSTDTAINGNYNAVAGTVCATDHGTFSLTKQ